MKAAFQAHPRCTIDEAVYGTALGPDGITYPPGAYGIEKKINLNLVLIFD